MTTESVHGMELKGSLSRLLHRALSDLKEKDPQVFYLVEGQDPTVVDLETLEEMILATPDGMVRGWMLGIYNHRLLVNTLTGATI